MHTRTLGHNEMLIREALKGRFRDQVAVAGDRYNEHAMAHLDSERA